MSGHNCPPSHASPFSSVACMKETKGQRWTWSHDNRLTGSVAKGIGDKVAQTWGDKVMAWGDRKVTRWGQRWVTASDQLHCIMFCPSSSLSVFLTVIRSLSVHLSCLSRTPSHTPSHLWTLFTSPWQEVCVCGFFVWLSVHVWMCVYMCVRLCANMEVLVYSHMSGVQPYVFVAAFAPVRPLLSHFLLFHFFLVLILFECFTAVGILPVCAHSSESQPWRAQPKGRHTYSCWQLRTTRGRKWKVLPSFHTPAISHTDSATNHDKCASLFVCLCLGTAYICISMRRATYYTF